MTKSAAQSPGRRYSGLAPEERARQRRAAMLVSALEIFGTSGYSGSSVKQICRGAGLTERYFYESFKDREGCLAALYADLSGEMRATTLAAVEGAGTDVEAVTAAGLEAFIRYLTADPRRARVILIEAVGVSPAMEQRRNRVLSEFAEIVEAVWAAWSGRTLVAADKLTAIALVGGVNYLLVDWLMKGSEQAPEDLVDVCTTLFSAARERLDAAAGER